MKILNRAIWISQTIAGLLLASGYASIYAWMALPVILLWTILFIIGWKLNWKWVPGFSY
jgi:hypothetical protein